MSTNPEMIGNICKLDRDEWAAWANDDLLGRLRDLPEFSDGDVFIDSPPTFGKYIEPLGFSGILITVQKESIFH